MNFHHYESRVYELFGEGRTEEALDLIVSLPAETRSLSCFFDYAETNLRLLTGDRSGAMRVLSAVSDRGEWIEPRLLLQDPDFASLSDDPRFTEICSQFEERRRSTRGPEQPWLTVETGGRARGVAVVLHGSDSRAEHNREAWLPAVDLGWRVLLVNSPAPGRWAGAYDWPSYETARERVREALAAGRPEALSRGSSTPEPGVPGRGAERSAQAGAGQDKLGRDAAVPVVLAGFSRGGEMSIRLGLEGVGAARSVLAVCPAPVREPELLTRGSASVLEKAHLFSGGRDPQAECAETAMHRLWAASVQTEVRRTPDLGHEYPPSFGEELMGILQEL